MLQSLQEAQEGITFANNTLAEAKSKAKESISEEEVWLCSFKWVHIECGQSNVLVWKFLKNVEDQLKLK